MTRPPTPAALALFQAKATFLRLARGLSPAVPRWPVIAIPPAEPWAEARSPLWDRTAPHAERVLQAGKVQNLRVAARHLDGCSVPAGATFSFWRQVGWPGRIRGFVQGRELRQGCLIPSVGGGLCQLSNALYACALQAGLTIVERHAHTMVIPGSQAELGRDATVFWNYVDLRFRSTRPFRLRVDLTAEELVVQIRAAP